MEGRDDQPPAHHPESSESLTPSAAGDSTEGDQVMSEVHLGCPPYFSGPHISHFTISRLPVEASDDAYYGIPKNSEHQIVGLDEDGDLILNRRRKERMDDFVMTIQHNITSSIPNVGLQVWRAELVLADFVLHKMFTSNEFHGIVAMELGAGTGLVGMLLARVAKTVFITDVGRDVLDNCAMNVELNSKLIQSQSSVYVRELDWRDSWPPQLVVEKTQDQGRYSFWSSWETEEIQRASLIVAADVIYSDELTHAFFGILERIMSQSPDKVLYLALEKRYNFSIDDLDVVANGYSLFQSYLNKNDQDEVFDEPENQYSCFVGEPIDLMQIPQYVREYNRGNDVELWRIKHRKITL